MKTELLREDIVNHKIKNIWVTAWEDINVLDMSSIDRNPYYSQDIYIELDNGYIFGILDRDPFEEFPIVSVDIKTIDVNPADKSFLIDCIGMEIIEVLTANRMPTFCLLLKNKKLLFCSDYGPDSFGPLVSELDKKYKIGNFATYWGHNPLNLDFYNLQ